MIAVFLSLTLFFILRATPGPRRKIGSEFLCFHHVRKRIPLGRPLRCFAFIARFHWLRLFLIGRTILDWHIFVSLRATKYKRAVCAGPVGWVLSLGSIIWDASLYIWFHSFQSLCVTVTSFHGQIVPLKSQIVPRKSQIYITVLKVIIWITGDVFTSVQEIRTIDCLYVRIDSCSFHSLTKSIWISLLMHLR